MSIVVRYAPVPSSTIEPYDEVTRRLQESGELPADGFDYHVAFRSNGQLLVSEGRDSQDQWRHSASASCRFWLMLRLNIRVNPRFSRSTTSSGASDSRFRPSQMDGAKQSGLRQCAAMTPEGRVATAPTSGSGGPPRW